jgi:uncharacterized ferredoxin-like protein
MPKIDINDWPRYAPPDMARREGSIMAARLMANAALTAPKAGGVSTVECSIVYGEEEQEQIAAKMEYLARLNPHTKLWKQICRSEAVMVRESDCILLFGSTYAADSPLDADCGECGGAEGCDYVYSRNDFKYGQIDTFETKGANPDRLIHGPLCSQWVNDLGTAVGSAAFLGARLLVDTRPMMSVGIAALKLGYCPHSEFVVGLPVASLAKNPYVDITPDYPVLSVDRVMKQLRKNYSIGRQNLWFNYRLWQPKEPKEKDPGKEE